ncbi:MAG: hypothetical protein IJE29_05145 [Firmicutes bacterium]|nr:hypothetical protein [Bacillota bacterium]
MLNRFACGLCGRKPTGCGIKRVGCWQRLCLRMAGLLWQMFAFSTLLLFGFVLWQPCKYLLIVLFWQVLALMVWLQTRRF